VVHLARQTHRERQGAGAEPHAVQSGGRGDFGAARDCVPVLHLGDHDSVCGRVGQLLEPWDGAVVSGTGAHYEPAVPTGGSRPLWTAERASRTLRWHRLLVGSN
jgi:hypothetical protein